MLYLDHNATTPPDPEVIEAMLPFYSTHWFNPSSACYAARRVRKAIDTAREQVAELLGADPDEIIFTSGGTESNSTALVQLSMRGPWVFSATEHSSIREWHHRLKATADDEAAVTWPVDERGQPDLSWAKDKAARGCGVALHLANNETGIILPVETLTAPFRQAGGQVLVDAVQALGKIPFCAADTGADFLSLSAHKIHGPKGVGALWIRSGTAMTPMLPGGGQEAGRRSGTENVAGIVGFGLACQKARAFLERDGWSGGLVRNHFETLLREAIPEMVMHGAEQPRLPNTSHFRIPGVTAAEVLLMLDDKGLCASAGSACQALGGKVSHVLLAMGLQENEAKSALRFSFGRDHTLADAEKASQLLQQMVTRFRERSGG